MRSALVAAVIVAAVLFVPANETHAATIGVPRDFLTIASALDAAASGDTVLVACGVYREIDLVVRPGVCLISEARDPDCAILDGEFRGRIVSVIGGGRDTEIQGFTLTHGRASAGVAEADLPLDAWFDYVSGRGGSGGAPLCEDSSVSVIRCRFRENRAGSGAAVYCEASTPARPCFVGCEFLDNDSVDGFDISSFSVNEPLFEDCVLDSLCYRHESALDFNESLYR
jgi:hypothetical protein